ncbi:hypothetical protein F441_09883 [Phytophthora nicotianae CJ01A1]|uniref:tRNA-splicing endonuclease subunit Sen54 N-terminal domain-containing protein n=5 Tax=Phytophthora nicotianae TaxID=4792 RepID=V9F1X6_PHYNI|nr:hypothetical protein F443_09934 [Phytophthora nicotianae P1569]ETK85462.1 hypothetical protein L915_09731 [Phytophthora nicotianae]ETO74169.1 hypothetical protein F444_10029 [Phytophthora nicotianae P1976]ETP15334.1 hypothetical protein F441_09883 [Phytophthora nicotianae CJ01A1]ETP43408.1 hypothetical protein F442_09837 [Phytophthora nicotianae P10297]
MAHPGKVSVGEYDPVTGLTHITQQCGRLLFNMGASVKKQQRRDPPPANALAKTTAPPTSTGKFTGLSLYPEEANYLLQRGALVVYLMPQAGEEAQALSVAGFTAMLFKDTRVSLACMEVYAFLKDQKLHPRRCLETMTASSSDDGRSVPRHLTEGEHCDVAFDVWKTVTVGVETSKTDDTIELSLAKPKAQKTKKLALVFRVAVCRFGDAPPNPRNLRRVVENSKARDLESGDDCAGADCRPQLTCSQIPVKLAVVHHDQSVLLFEINTTPFILP